MKTRFIITISEFSKQMVLYLGLKFSTSETCNIATLKPNFQYSSTKVTSFNVDHQGCFQGLFMYTTGTCGSTKMKALALEVSPLSTSIINIEQ